MTAHAGAGEHSTVLFVRPATVGAGFERAPSQTAASFDDLVAIAQKDDWPGYFGAPRHASAALGARQMKLEAAKAIELAEKVLDGWDARRAPRYAKLMRERGAAAVAVLEGALAHDAEQEDRQREWLRKKGLK